MKNSPDRSWIYNTIGIIFNEKKLYDKTIELLQKLIKLRPNFVPAYCNLGVAYSK